MAQEKAKDGHVIDEFQHPRLTLYLPDEKRKMCQSVVEKVLGLDAILQIDHNFVVLRYMPSIPQVQQLKQLIEIDQNLPFELYGPDHEDFKQVPHKVWPRPCSYCHFLGINI